MDLAGEPVALGLRRVEPPSVQPGALDCHAEDVANRMEEAQLVRVQLLRSTEAFRARATSLRIDSSWLRRLS